MLGEPESISKDLARFFVRKLVVATPAEDFLRKEPVGYHSTWDSESCRPVLRHVASGIRVAVDPIDVIERVDRRDTAEPSRIVFVYLSVAAGDTPTFTEAARLANTRPRVAFNLLVKHGLLRPVEGSENTDGLGWYTGNVTSMDPAHVFRRMEHRVMARPEEPWYGADFCIAFHTFARCIRPVAGGAPEVLQIQEPTRIHEAPDDAVEVDYGVQLMEAASRRDPAGVRKCLEAGADPNFVDTRGWSALHAASAIRPAWEVFELLLPVCDIVARTKLGQLPVDLADKCGQADTAAVLRERMRKDKKGCHLLV